MPDWTPRLIEGARLVLEFVLVIVAAYLLARIAWLIISPGEAVSTLTPRPLPAPVASSTSAGVRADISLLMTTNPFEAGDGEASAIPDAPATQLNLRLAALFMSTGDEESGSATIVTPDNVATRYELGDEILPGVRLERILADRVIISRDGTEETLMRGGREPGLSVIGDPSEPRSEAGRVSREAPATFAPGVTAQTLLAGLDLEPVEESGQVAAFVIQPKGDNSLIMSAGLEPGDRLVEIDGTRVSDIDTSALAARIGSSRTVTLVVLRNDRPTAIEIRFKEE